MTGYKIRLYVRDSDILSGEPPYIYAWELHNVIGVFSMNGFSNSELRLGFTYPSERTMFTVTLTVTDSRHFSTSETFVYYYGEFFKLDNRVLVQNPWGLYMTLAPDNYLQVNWSNIIEFTPENNLQINIYGSLDGTEKYDLIGYIREPSSEQSFITNIRKRNNSIYRFKVSTYNTVNFEERFNTEGPVSYATEFSCHRDDVNTWVTVNAAINPATPNSVVIDFTSFLFESTIRKIVFTITESDTGTRVYVKNLNLLDESVVLIEHLSSNTIYTITYDAYALDNKDSYILVNYLCSQTFQTAFPCTSPTDLVAISNTGEVTLTWTEASYPINVLYRILYKKSTDENWSLTQGHTSPHTITGLEEGIGYDFKLQTVCTFGESASTIVHVSPLKIAPIVTSLIVGDCNYTIIPPLTTGHKPTIVSLQKINNGCLVDIIIALPKKAPVIQSLSLFDNPCIINSIHIILEHIVSPVIQSFSLLNSPCSDSGILIIHLAKVPPVITDLSLFSISCNDSGIIIILEHITPPIVQSLSILGNYCSDSGIIIINPTKVSPIVTDLSIFGNSCSSNPANIVLGHIVYPIVTDFSPLNNSCN